jgi:hypothetical protein
MEAAKAQNWAVGPQKKKWFSQQTTTVSLSSINRLILEEASSVF